MRRDILIVALTLALLALPPATAGEGSDATSGETEVKARLYQEAVTAYKAKDYAGFLAAAGKMLALDPANPKYIYNAACAEALTGHNADAVRHIAALLDRGLDFGFDEEPDFASLRASKEFEPIREKLARLRKPVGKSEVAFTLPEKDQIPEGVAFDPKTKTWFISSVHRRKIVSLTPDGKVSDFILDRADGLGAVLGIAFEPGGARFYVADYSGGIRLIDVATRERRDVTSPDGFPLLGIDGVVYFEGSLIVTQNGIRPHRVTRLFLDAKGERIDRGEILEMNNPIFAEPTLGTVVDGAYYYVANSQWGMFDGGGKLAPIEKLSGPIILKLPLPPH